MRKRKVYGLLWSVHVFWSHWVFFSIHHWCISGPHLAPFVRRPNGPQWVLACLQQGQHHRDSSTHGFFLIHNIRDSSTNGSINIINSYGKSPNLDFNLQYYNPTFGYGIIWHHCGADMFEISSRETSSMVSAPGELPNFWWWSIPHCPGEKLSNLFSRLPVTKKETPDKNWRPVPAFGRVLTVSPRFTSQLHRK